MLIERSQIQEDRDIALVARDAALLAVLGALLEEWRYRVVPQADFSTLVLLEEGCPPPPRRRGLIRLGRPIPGMPDRLALPLSIEELWSALEQRFHKPPRKHIRIDLLQPMQVTARGRQEATTMVSLSDLGTRFALRQELVNDELLEIDLELDGRAWHLQGRVIYVIPRGDHDGSGGYDIGMIFLHTAAAHRTLLREFVVRGYLERVARRFPAAVFRSGLDYFQLSPELARSLAGG